MKKKTNIIILLLVVITLSSMVMDTAHEYKTSSLCDAPLVGGHTGAPGETSCTGCHGGTANTGPGALSFDLGGVTQYAPNQTYTGTVKLNQTGVNKFGFVSLALQNTGNTTIGAFSLIDTVRTRLFVDGSRNYVGHTPCGADATPADSTQWQFKWTAPATNVGNITLYLGSLATNHNHATSGDNTYTSSIVLTPATTSIEEISGVLTELNVYPNPVSDYLSVSFQMHISEPVSIELVDINGRTIEVFKQESVSPGIIKKSIDIKDKNIKPGIYFMKVCVGDKFISKNISIQ
ncbi:MAG: choice-of-anchor V domain-containing protein [Bacteroidota bacterium]